jgi:hypothetical protein
VLWEADRAARWIIQQGFVPGSAGH